MVKYIYIYFSLNAEDLSIGFEPLVDGISFNFRFPAGKCPRTSSARRKKENQLDKIIEYVLYCTRIDGKTQKREYEMFQRASPFCSAPSFRKELLKHDYCKTVTKES